MDQEAAASDIFSLTDQVLSDRLQFVEEIGFGNWGSVWLCRPKSNSSSSSVEHPSTKIAVKLVHRSKTPTTAARVRSLWNEMKIVREFKNDPHPSIIPFHSFIITPSYALITMAYLPTLIPVEVEESKAKVWFRYLLSGVEFLHKRGVVHNDIKPANILISHNNVPVLVDFGFAEKYDLKSSKAFHSNLSYGTPEYLSPERARGLPHDTRKSDVWSLGVTFFEILVGRTPFENSDAEHFTTKDDLEKYWARTLKGKWVGTWTISKPMESLLRRMVAPNADLRCTAAEAMIDDFWARNLLVPHSPDSSAPLPASLKKAIAAAKGVPEDPIGNTPSVFKTLSPRLVEVLRENGNYPSPSTPFSPGEKQNPNKSTETPQTPNPGRHTMARTKSQTKVGGTPKSQPRKRGPANLTPIKGSPPVTPHSQRAKENARVRSPASPSSARKPMAPVFGMMNNLPAPPAKKPSSQFAANKRKVIPAPGVLGDMTARARNVENTWVGEVSADISAGTWRSKGSGSKAGDRVKEWEREKERLREMAKLEEVERERDEEIKKEKKRAERRDNERQSKTGEKEKKSQGELVKDAAPGLIVPLVTSNSNTHSRPSSRQQIQTHARIQPVPLNPRLHFQMLATPQTRVLGLRNGNRPPSSLSQHVVDSPPAASSTTPATPSVLSSANSSVFASTPIGTSTSATATSTPLPGLPRLGNESGLSLFKHNVKMSIDKTVRLYKSSTLGQVTSGRNTPLRSISAEGFNGGERLFGRRKSEESEGSWEDELLDRESKSSLRKARVSTEARADRMTVWVRNVEKVVEDARQNFASAAILPLSSLPPAPVSRSTSRNKSSYNPQLSRRVIPSANQIFHNNGDASMTEGTSANVSADVSGTNESSVVHPGRDLTMSVHSRMKELPSTPQRMRRATVSTRSPEPARKAEFDIDTTGSPSKRKEKCKSHGNFLQAKITPIPLLELQLKQCEQPPPSQRLSAVIDKSLFIAPPSSRPSAEFLCEAPTPQKPSEIEDELLSSPFHVEPYPARKPTSGQNLNVPDTPSRHRLEGVYDRFLMAASGVKRVGKGYQSENVVPIENRSLGASAYKRGAHRAIHSARRQMPPPVASDDLRKAASADELGIVNNCDSNGSPSEMGTGTTISLVRRALKAVVTSKNSSRRMSRVAV